MNKSTSYKCDKCTKSFSRKDYLTRHEFNHNKIKPFRCEICNFSFTRSDLLAKHCKTKSHLNRLVTNGGIIKIARNTIAASGANSRHLQRRSMSLSEIMEKNSFTSKDTVTRLSAPAFLLLAHLDIKNNKFLQKSGLGNDIYDAIEDDDEDYNNTEVNSHLINGAVSMIGNHAYLRDIGSNTQVMPSLCPSTSTLGFGLLSTSSSPMAMLPPLTMQLGSICAQRSKNLADTAGMVSGNSNSSNSVQASMSHTPEENRHKMRISSVLNYD